MYRTYRIDLIEAKQTLRKVGIGRNKIGRRGKNEEQKTFRRDQRQEEETTD